MKINGAGSLIWTVQQQNAHVKQEDDYFSGPHHYWTHLVCGVIVGSLLGLWIGWGASSNKWIILAIAVIVSVGFGYSSGRWGDRAWRWLIERLHLGNERGGDQSADMALAAQMTAQDKAARPGFVYPRQRGSRQ